MTSQQEQLDTLQEIKTLMEKSSRFLSLSGISGIVAGILALTGAFTAYLYLDIGIMSDGYLRYALRSDGGINLGFLTFFITDAGLVLILSLAASFYFSWRKAKKEGLKIWDKTALRMATSFFVPLITGALFCILMVYHRAIGLIAPCTLLFYGLALLNASKYTFNELRFLGISEIILGLLATFFIGFGIIFWAIGFGILHIVYGTAMYFKYER